MASLDKVLQQIDYPPDGGSGESWPPAHRVVSQARVRNVHTVQDFLCQGETLTSLGLSKDQLHRLIHE
eukprot:gene3014-3574_t